jgi:exopolysaccharide biosynthesis WecB/TagA/CpsF family protein
MSPQLMTTRMSLGGNIVERHEFDEVVSIVAARLESASTRGLVLGSVNLDHLHQFHHVAAAPNDQLDWMFLADGMPIAWLGHLLTGEPWHRIAGADLLDGVLALAQQTGQRVGFFGGSAETHRRLAESVARHHPGLAISGMWAPDADAIESSSDDLAAEIRTARTDILVVSLGKPRQEQWIDQHGAATGARILLPCGGAIDFLAGTTKRAPGWMQRSGLEWLHRLSHEPRRLARRYLVQGPVALVRATRAQLVRDPGRAAPDEPPFPRWARVAA